MFAQGTVLTKLTLPKTRRGLQRNLLTLSLASPMPAQAIVVLMGEQ